MVSIAQNKKTKLTGNIIVDEAISWNNEQNAPIPQWHMDELDKTDEEIKSGKIKYINSDEFDISIMQHISEFFSNKKKNV